jgi:predicted PurR-regulated permease PerM
MFAANLPQYTDQINANIANLKTTLKNIGIDQSQVDKVLKNINPATIFDAIGSIVSSVAGLATNLLFVLVLVLFMGVDSSVFHVRSKKAPAHRTRVLNALGSFAFGTRKYFAVATIFGAIVAVLDWIALLIFAIPAPGLWALLAFVTNYIPNIGFIIGLIPVALLALVTGGVAKMVAIIIVYCVLNFVIQSVLQPKFVGDAVGLTTTMSFLSLIVWAYVLGPLGAILAIPVSLLVKAILIDSDPDARWLQLFFGDEPIFTKKDPNRPKRRILRRRHPQPAVHPTQPQQPTS